MFKKAGRLLLLLTFFTAALTMAQDAVVKVHVEPNQAFTFVDSQPVGEGQQTLKLTPGKHTIAVYNYGFKPIVREVMLASGKDNEEQRFELEAVGGPVSGPWGVLQIEGANRAAVLLNGKQPEFFVGHGDEFNNHMVNKQQLVVPAGTHYVTVVQDARELWSGKVEVRANQRVLVYVDRNGEMVVKDWPEGATFQTLPRFTAGVTTATVAVAPVSGSFAANPKQINCNEKPTLEWKTAEVLHTSITSHAESFPELPMTGERTVSPRTTTTYSFKTSGPGGIIESSETINVNPEVTASLKSSPEDVHYLRIGDKVIVQDHATLSWDVANANNITMQPFGTVAPVGSDIVTPNPKTNANGKIDETHPYRLVASNVCGGSATQLANVHLVGNIEPTISSVFFPTGYPDRGHPQKGLLRSQQERLATIATVFKLYMEHVPDAKLEVSGMADPRGRHNSNQRLSARRAMIVKDYLIAQGIPADRITLQMKGAEDPLDLATVKMLESENPQPPAPNWIEKPRPTKLAYDRRVDVAILPAAVDTARYYPHALQDSALLFSPRWLGESQIHSASD